MSRVLLMWLTFCSALFGYSQSTRKRPGASSNSFKAGWIIVGESPTMKAGSGFSAKLYRTGHIVYCTGNNSTYAFVLPDSTNNRLWSHIDRLKNEQFRSYETAYAIDGGSCYMLRQSSHIRPLRAEFLPSSTAPLIKPLFNQLSRLLLPPRGTSPQPPPPRSSTSPASYFPCSPDVE